MSTIRIKSNELGNTIAKRVRDTLHSDNLSSILVDRARIRIKNSKDSTISYPELWATRNEVGYREGGTPLKDDGHLVALLHSKSNLVSANTVRWTLKDGTGYGAKHQEGFTNKAPIAVPLNKTAARIIKGLGDPPHNISAIPDYLEEAPSLKEAREGRHGDYRGAIKWDYYVIEEDAEVPARPIANNPPEDIKAITRVVKRAIRGIK